MATKKSSKKPSKKTRNVSLEPMKDHVRLRKGAGRRPVAAIMVPQELKEEFVTWKEAYSDRFKKPVTAEQVLRRWMDGIGTAFDATTAKDARKRFRARQQEKKDAEKAAQEAPAAQDAATEEAAAAGDAVKEAPAEEPETLS